MADFALMHRRPDGTFVINLRGMPYHVIPADALFTDVAAAAEGVELPPDPVPPAPPEPAPARAPTRAELSARLDALAAQIAALP